MTTVTVPLTTRQAEWLADLVQSGSDAAARAWNAGVHIDRLTLVIPRTPAAMDALGLAVGMRADLASESGGEGSDWTIGERRTVLGLARKLAKADVPGAEPLTVSDGPGAPAVARADRRPLLWRRAGASPARTGSTGVAGSPPSPATLRRPPGGGAASSVSPASAAGATTGWTPHTPGKRTTGPANPPRPGSCSPGGPATLRGCGGWPWPRMTWPGCTRPTWAGTAESC